MVGGWFGKSREHGLARKGIKTTRKQCIDTTGMAVKKNFTEKDADKNELKVGIRIEMEHTRDKDVARQIALDHLSEIPDYYTRLVKMEKEAGIED